MRIKLRYFAMAREILGKGAEEREVGSGATAGSVFDELIAEASRLEAMKGTVLLMVNQEYVKPETHAERRRRVGAHSTGQRRGE